MMTETEILNFLRDPENGFNPKVDLQIRDGQYAALDHEYFYGPFCQQCKNWMKAEGIDKYEPERNDCDDFTDSMRFFGFLKHMASNVHARGLALGKCEYTRDPDKVPGDTETRRHAICFALWRAPGETKWPFGMRIAFVDPQPCARIDLSATEKLSVTLLAI